MGNEYSSPFDYPECKEKHNSFKDVNTNFTFGDKISIASRIFTNNIEDTFLFQYTKRCKMIKDGDLEYLKIISKKYGFENLSSNLIAFSRDVTSGWDEWLFPVSDGKSALSIKIIEEVSTFSSCLNNLNCKYINDFDYFIKCIDEKEKLDLEFILVCIKTNVRLCLEHSKIFERLNEINKKLSSFLRSWNDYKQHFNFSEEQALPIENKCKEIIKRNNDQLYNLEVQRELEYIRRQDGYYDYDDDRPRFDDDDYYEEERRKEEEREEEERREQEDYDFYYGDDDY